MIRSLKIWLLNIGSDMIAKELVLEVGGVLETQLTENDLVFVWQTVVLLLQQYGDNNTPAQFQKNWVDHGAMEKLNKQDEHGHPSILRKLARPKLVRFSYNNFVKRQTYRWVHSKKSQKRDPYAGKWIVTVRDPNWMMSYTLNRQPHFKSTK